VGYSVLRDTQWRPYFGSSGGGGRMLVTSNWKRRFANERLICVSRRWCTGWRGFFRERTASSRASMIEESGREDT
jgi:hypothetical protein